MRTVLQSAGPILLCRRSARKEHVVADKRTVLDEDLPAEAGTFLNAVAPCRQGLVVGAASRRTRSLADIRTAGDSNHPGATEVS